jgi:site-specific recombinase XerD
MDNCTLLQYNLSFIYENYREYLISVINLRPITAKNYISDLNFFFGWLSLNINNSILDAYQIDFEQSILKNRDLIQLIFNYKNYLITNKLPIKTINRRLSSLRTFFSFCISQGWIKQNPAKQVANAGTLSFNKTNRKSGPLINTYLSDLDRSNVTETDLHLIRDDLNEFISST